MSDLCACGRAPTACTPNSCANAEMTETEVSNLVAQLRRFAAPFDIKVADKIESLRAQLAAAETEIKHQEKRVEAYREARFAAESQLKIAVEALKEISNSARTKLHHNRTIANIALVALGSLTKNLNQ